MSRSDIDKVFAGSIPQLYDDYLVPLIFEPYATTSPRRAARATPSRVLEIAAGTGVVTRALARALPAATEIVATDLNQAMLDQAAQVGTARPVRVAPGRRDASAVRRRRVRRRRLPVRRDVLSRQGRRPSPKRGACCAAAARSCSTSGTASRTTNSPTWSRTRSPRSFPADPPRFMARTPHGYHDRATIARDLARRRLRGAGADRHGRGAQPRALGAPSRRSPTARARRCATRSRRATPRASARRPTSPLRRSRAASAPAPVDGKIQAHVVAVER